MTNTIQLALTDDGKANALKTILTRSIQVPVVRVDCPDLRQATVVVVDTQHLDRLPVPLSDPDRVILISRSDERSLKDAWDAGVQSMVSEQDPLNTVALAVMAACLRASSARMKNPGGGDAAH